MPRARPSTLAFCLVNNNLNNNNNKKMNADFQIIMPPGSQHTNAISYNK